MNYKLKAARKRLGLSQAETARIVGVSTRMYQGYELEESEPRASTAIRIADALNVQDLRELWKRKEVEINGR